MTSPRNGSKMAREIAQIPEVIQRQVDAGLSEYVRVGAEIAALSPRAFTTCARGTSDQAAVYFKYLSETLTGLPVASLGPSVASLYRGQLKLRDMICVTISQSGGSPDLAALQAAAQKGGARTLAILNETDSPVGMAADQVLPVFAGPEEAVAATKSFVATLVAITGFFAGFLGNKELETAILNLPDTAAAALNTNWSEALVPMARAKSLFSIGRGSGLAVAGEAALKLKETCRIHAEAFSAAEVLHGPIVLTDRSLVALCFVPEDQGHRSVIAAARALKAGGATVFLVNQSSAITGSLSLPNSPHPLLTAITQIIGFYRFVENLSHLLGENADSPKGLKKVTQTT